MKFLWIETVETDNWATDHYPSSRTVETCHLPFGFVRLVEFRPNVWTVKSRWDELDTPILEEESLFGTFEEARQQAEVLIIEAATAKAQHARDWAITIFQWLALSEEIAQ